MRRSASVPGFHKTVLLGQLVCRSFPTFPCLTSSSLLVLLSAETSWVLRCRNHHGRVCGHLPPCEHAATSVWIPPLSTVWCSTPRAPLGMEVLSAHPGVQLRGTSPCSSRSLSGGREVLGPLFSVIEDVIEGCLVSVHARLTCASVTCTRLGGTWLSEQSLCEEQGSTGRL